MRKSIKLALAATMALSATSAFATNGDNLIGLGAKSRAMGGTGIAHYGGAESATSNPALIAKGKGTRFSFGGTYFRPDVEVKVSGTVFGTGAYDGSYESRAKNNVIPFIALTENLENGFSIGASMFGSAGMGTDWRGAGSGALNNPDLTPAFAMAAPTGDLGLYSMRSNLLLLKFSVPIAYGQDNWSVGIAPVMMYGALDIAFQQPATMGAANPNTGLPCDPTNPTAIANGCTVFPNGGGNSDVGRGSSNDFGFGFEAGAAYTLPDLGITLGAVYHSAIEMKYEKQISVASQAFGYGTTNPQYGVFSDTLEQPAEIGFGLDWTQGDISVTADYKMIQWGDAEGYEDFNWDDQDVIALGVEYKMDDLSLRLGFNYAENPIDESTDTGSVTGYPITQGGNSNGDTINAFNAVMFPAITEMHYTIGAGYQFSKNVGADLAFTYGTSDDEKYSAQSVGLGTLEVTNDQIAVSGNLNYTF